MMLRLVENIRTMRKDYCGAAEILRWGMQTLSGLRSSERVSFLDKIDATLLAQQPKVSPYTQQMVQNIAAALEIDESRVSVKATTEEHLGFTGSGEGMAAHAVALVEKSG